MSDGSDLDDEVEVARLPPRPAPPCRARGRARRRRRRRNLHRQSLALLGRTRAAAIGARATALSPRPLHSDMARAANGDLRLCSAEGVEEVHLHRGSDVGAVRTAVQHRPRPGSEHLVQDVGEARASSAVWPRWRRAVPRRTRSLEPPPPSPPRRRTLRRFPSSACTHARVPDRSPIGASRTRTRRRTCAWPGR